MCGGRALSRLHSRPCVWGELALVRLDGRPVIGAHARAPGRGARGAKRCMRAEPTEADSWHVPVDRLVLASAHFVRLVPDADVTGRPHPLVELLPGGQMRRAGIARKAL